MSKREYLERVLREEMEKEDIDAVIGVSPENVQHLAGVFIASQRMIRDRLAFAIYRRNGPPMFVVSTVVKYTAESKSWIDDVITYREHVVMPIDGLVPRRWSTRALRMRASGWRWARCPRATPTDCAPSCRSSH